MLVGEEKVEVVMVQVLDHDWPQNLRVVHRYLPSTYVSQLLLYERRMSR